MAAVKEGEKSSSSWNESISQRLGGSSFVSAVLRELLKEIRRQLPVETYQQLTADVKQTLFDEIDVRFPLEPPFCRSGELLGRSNPGADGNLPESLL